MKVVLTVNKGFTVLELLVVVGVISLIVSIVAPQLVNTQRSYGRYQKIQEIEAAISLGGTLARIYEHNVLADFSGDVIELSLVRIAPNLELYWRDRATAVKPKEISVLRRFQVSGITFEDNSILFYIDGRLSGASIFYEYGGKRYLLEYSAGLFGE